MGSSQSLILQYLNISLVGFDFGVLVGGQHEIILHQFKRSSTDNCNSGAPSTYKNLAIG
jgi:hypothetical protein